MSSDQGRFAGSLSYPEKSYYGRPLYRDYLMRFDFPQPYNIIEPRWSDKYPGYRPLGIAKSGKFAIYMIRKVPVYMNRFSLKSDLRPHIPPTDRFDLRFENRYDWAREEVKMPLVFPEFAQPELILRSQDDDITFAKEVQ